MVFLLLCIRIIPQLYNFGFSSHPREAVLKRHEMQCKNFFFSFTFSVKDDQYKNVMNVIKYLDTN